MQELSSLGSIDAQGAKTAIRNIFNRQVLLEQSEGYSSGKIQSVLERFREQSNVEDPF